jgi:hypothetical protein
VKTTLLLSLTLLTACANFDRERVNTSVGLIGCPAREIALYNVSPSPVTLGSWTAVCRGQAFDCSVTGRDVQCARDPFSPDPRGPADHAEVDN